MKSLLPIVNNILCHVIYYYQKTISTYRSLNQKQRVVFYAGGGLLLILLILLSLALGHINHYRVKQTETFTTGAKSYHTANKQVQPYTVINHHTTGVTHEQVTKALGKINQHYQSMNEKLHRIQSGLGQMASAQSVEQVQQTVAIPNPVLLTKVNRLQQSVNVIKVQTAKKTFIPAKTVEHYFRLAAVQVFSDGMRSIIDVQGHQTLLSVNEICPACRGWTLKKMNFANQSAVFENSKQQYVYLQTN